MPEGQTGGVSYRRSNTLSVSPSDCHLSQRERQGTFGAVTPAGCPSSVTAIAVPPSQKGKALGRKTIIIFPKMSKTPLIIWEFVI